VGSFIRTPTLRVLLVVAPFALLAACGGGGDAPITPVDATTDTTPQLSKREFVERADAICAEANAAIANLATSGVTDPTLLVVQEREITSGMLGSVRTLGVPSGDEATLSAYFAAVQNQVTILERQQGALQNGDTAAAAAFGAELSAADFEALTAAQEFGFQRCGQEGEVLVPGPTDGTGVPDPVPSDGGTDSGGGDPGGGSSGGISPD
jgi:hypothetical protein